MPLTRRVQVFLNEEASEKFDLLLKAHKLGPTALIQTLIFQANPLDALPTKTDSQPDTKLDRSTERIDEDFDERRRGIRERISRGASALPDRINAPQTSLDAVGPTVESGRGKASVETVKLPLKRDKIVPIPKPSQRKGNK